MYRIDSHCHLWSLERGDYGWLESSDPELAPIVRDFNLSDLETVASASETGRCILVQAAPSEAESDFLVSIGEQSELIGGVVGWVDLADSHAEARLGKFAAMAKAKGIRPMLQDIEDTDWILGATQNSNLAVVEKMGLRFEALIQPRHLSAILKMCQTHSELPVVVNHAAKPVLGAETNDVLHSLWSEGMAALACNSTAFCKLSGLLTEMRPDQRNTQSNVLSVLQPVFDQLLNWFGPQRLIWGSDWPVLTLAAGYDAWVQTTDALLAPLSSSEKQAIIRGNAARFYSLGEDQV